MKAAAGNAHENATQKMDFNYMSRGIVMLCSPYTRHENFLPDVEMLISGGTCLTQVHFCLLLDLVL